MFFNKLLQPSVTREARDAGKDEDLLTRGLLVIEKNNNKKADKKQKYNQEILKSSTLWCKIQDSVFTIRTRKHFM